MAGANLNDDVTLCSAVLAGVCRLLVTKGWLPVHEFTSVAGAAGLTPGQVGQFSRGEVTLPPHQCLVLMAAVFDKIRLRGLAMAESRASGTAPPVASETSLKGAEAAVATLAKDFKAWRFDLPDGAGGLDDPETPSKLTWWAKHAKGDWDDVHGNSARELRAKLEQVEAAMVKNRKYDGRLFPRGST
jgi:hypothetical protein